jgi:hypothetical protein
LRLGEGVESLAGGDVPDFDGAVGSAGDQALAVGRECDGIDRVDVVFVGADFFFRCDVPQLDQLVIAGGGDGAAVGREGDPLDAIGVAANGVE